MSAKYNADPKLQEKARQLIATGNTSDALLLLFENGFDQAIDLKKRYDEAWGHFEARRFDFGALSLIQNQVNFEILTLISPETGINSPSNAVENRSMGKQSSHSYVSKAAVIELLEQNQVVAALKRCKNLGKDQIMLLARYHSGQRFVFQGLLADDVWAIELQRIQYALQELIKNAPDSTLIPASEPIVQVSIPLPKNAAKSLLKRIRELLRY